MTRAPEVLTLARSWIGTPYVHQASRKGAGSDCLGLLRGIWVALYGSEPEPTPAYTPDWSEPQGNEVLWAAAARHLRQKRWSDAVPGDVVLFRMQSGSVAKHLGILANGLPDQSFIHAYSGHGVVESQLTAPWRRRVVTCFECPDRSS